MTGTGAGGGDDGPGTPGRSRRLRRRAEHYSPEEWEQARQAWRDAVPWEHPMTRGDKALVAATAGVLVLAVGTLPVRPFLLASHPVLLSAVTGSLSAIGAGAAFARIGEGALWLVIVAGVVGMIKFDWLFWLAGRQWGAKVVEMWAPGDFAKRFVARVRAWPSWALPLVIVAAALPGIPAPAVFAVAGLGRMRLVPFLVCDAIGAALIAGLVAGLGYGLGQSAVDVVLAIDSYALWITLALVAVVSVRAGRRGVREDRARRAASHRGREVAGAAVGGDTDHELPSDSRGEEAGGDMTDVRDQTDEKTALATELIDAVAVVMGSVPGHRVTHAKGVVLTGTFTATPRARELTRAAHMAGDPVRVSVRFSNGAGDPHGLDAAENDPRGMAVKFYLPDGSETDLVCQSWPVFPAATPEDFLGLMRAQGSGPVATEDFLKEKPYIAEALDKIAALGDPPLAWSRMAFNSLNAFRLVDAEGAGRFARFRLEPEGGEASLPADRREGAADDYLMDGVLGEVPVRHRVLAQLADDGDQTTDASQAWPAEREWVDLGVVEITGPDTERERDGDVLVNDPTRLTDGIEPSDDPILHMRPHIYAESIRRRTGG